MSDGRLEKSLKDIRMRPYFIEQRFKLRNPSTAKLQLTAHGERMKGRKNI